MVERIMLTPGVGESIADHGATLKPAMGPRLAHRNLRSVIGHGSDVGAHLHAQRGNLLRSARKVDLVAFQPGDRSVGDWREWMSATGRWVLRGTPRAFMNVPADVPHAFADRSTVPVLLLSSVPGGHKRYFPKLADLVRGGGTPGRQAIIGQQERYDIVHLAPLRSGGG